MTTKRHIEKARRELNYYLTLFAMFLTAVVLPLPLMALFVNHFTIPVVALFTAIITTLVMVAILWTQLSLNQ